MNHYKECDHADLALLMTKPTPFKWIMSYDNTLAIRRLYRSHFRQVAFNLGYSASDARMGSELLIFSASLNFPKAWTKRVPDKFITAREQIGEPMPLVK